MENQGQKPYTAEEKVAILRRPRIKKVTGPDLCDENPLHPRVFYRWLKTFSDRRAATFGPPPRAEKQVEAREQRIAFLEAKPVSAIGSHAHFNAVMGRIGQTYGALHARLVLPPQPFQGLQAGRIRDHRRNHHLEAVRKDEASWIVDHGNVSGHRSGCGINVFSSALL